MQLRPDWGTYIPALVTLEGSFRVNGTSDPDDIRDGNTNIIASVVLTSTGLFTVTFDDGFPIPERMVTEIASLQPNDGSPAKVCTCAVVADSYSQATRSFQILTTKVADTGEAAYFDPLVANPDDNSRISFFLRGSVQGIGTDPA